MMDRSGYCADLLRYAAFRITAVTFLYFMLRCLYGY